ncbi:hypothetical protein, partial [Poseidonibacter sp.]|uniref:hypothetical protein n=1 Tax=Poseidonibacter sp. TaxID=2321188 RepID=UPI003C728990
FNEYLINFYLKNRTKLYLYNYKDFEINQWTIDDIVNDSVSLSAKLINNYVVNEDEVEYWIEIRSKNKELYLALVLAGIIVGHIGAIAINSYEYKLMKEGILNEIDLKTSIINNNDIEYLYIPTIVIEKNFRKPEILKNLLFSFIEMILAYKSLKFIIVNVYSLEGENLSKNLGFKYIINHNDGGKIYTLDVSKKNNLSIMHSKFKK